jgi:hypothetical protein
VCSQSTLYDSHLSPQDCAIGSMEGMVLTLIAVSALIITALLFALAWEMGFRHLERHYW